MGIFILAILFTIITGWQRNKWAWLGAIITIGIALIELGQISGCFSFEDGLNIDVSFYDNENKILLIRNEVYTHLTVDDINVLLFDPQYINKRAPRIFEGLFRFISSYLLVLTFLCFDVESFF